MYYKIKKVTVKKNGNLSLLAADSNIWPIRYYTHQVPTSEGKGEKELLEDFFENVSNGNFHPLESCKIKFSAQRREENVYPYIVEMVSLKSRTCKYIKLNSDLTYDCDFTKQLNKLVAGFAANWVYEKRQANSKEFNMVKYLDERAKETYQKKDKEFNNKKILIVNAAIRSDIFEDYDALLNHKEGTMFLGKRENYDNHGHYNNADNSAIILLENDEFGASALFDFFGNCYWHKEEKKPEIEWEKLYDIPGWKAAKKLYEII